MSGVHACMTGSSTLVFHAVPFFSERRRVVTCISLSKVLFSSCPLTFGVKTEDGTCTCGPYSVSRTPPRSSPLIPLPPSPPSLALPPLIPLPSPFSDRALCSQRLPARMALFAFCSSQSCGPCSLLSGARKAGSHPVSPNLDARTHRCPRAFHHACKPFTIHHFLLLPQFLSSAGRGAEIVADFRRRRP